jgi:beta-phosphoglucomutase-like phosphatase (HAD superfamily)
MLEELGAPPELTPAQLFHEADSHFAALIQTTPKMPGAGETVAALARAGVPMCLATSSMRHHVVLKRVAHELGETMMDMCVGERRKLIVPAHLTKNLASKHTEAQGQTLEFELELAQIVAYKQEL